MNENNGYEMNIDDDINHFGSIEDVQDNIFEKLSKMFSFYNEQEFLDEINGIK